MIKVKCLFGYATIIAISNTTVASTYTIDQQNDNLSPFQGYTTSGLMGQSSALPQKVIR